MSYTTLVTAFITGFIIMSASGQSIHFDQDKVGSLPAHWKCGVTGSGTPRWEVSKDDTAATRPNVFRQNGQGDYPWCVLEGVQIGDGTAEVKFKAISGEDDQAGGIVWRFKDGDNYYIARGNALENNVSLYYTQNGKRKTLKYVDAAVKKNEWNNLRVEFSGKRIRVLLNGKTYIEQDDDHIMEAGSVGVWTKGDSVTSFDDFTYSALIKK